MCGSSLVPTLPVTMSSTSPTRQQSHPWRREFRAVSRLAVPVVLVQVGTMVFGLVDQMMVGRLPSAEAAQRGLAAVQIGDTITWAVLLVGMGILMALDPLVSQAHGAGDVEGVAHHFETGVAFALLIAVPCSIVMWFGEPILTWFDQPPDVVPVASDYLRGVLWGNPAFLMFFAVRQTLQAMSIVRPLIVAIVLGNVLNAVANWVLVFGHLGFPELGVLGSAYATTFSRWVLFLGVLWAARERLQPYWNGLRLTSFPIRRDRRKLLVLGIPVAIHFGLEMWIFAYVSLLMGQLGERALAGHAIAIRLASLSFMFPLGVSFAAATRVGNAIGRGDMDGARRAADTCLLIGASIMLVSATAFAFLPEVLAHLFTDNANVVAMACTLLPVAAVFQVYDGTQVVASGILRGAADTHVPAVLALVGYWLLGLPLGLYLSEHSPSGARGLWWGLTVGLATVAILLSLRIRARFRSVIERV